MIFQAKDIQRIVEIQKHRYEYIASKIGIPPDIDEVEGQGNIHKYSFRNLLQFGIVHAASGLGLTPKASRALLFYLEKMANYPGLKLNIYDPDDLGDISVHYVMDKTRNYFCTSFYSDDQEERMILSEFGERYFVPSQKATFLYDAIGYITLNLRSLKKKIVENLGE